MWKSSPRTDGVGGWGCSGGRLEYPGVQFGTCVVIWTGVFLAFLSLWSRGIGTIGIQAHILAQGSMMAHTQSRAGSVLVQL